MMRRAAGLDADETGRQLGEERRHLRMSMGLSHHNLSCGVDAVDMLGPIQAGRRKLHGGWLLLRLPDSNPPWRLARLWPSCGVAERVDHTFPVDRRGSGALTQFR